MKKINKILLAASITLLHQYSFATNNFVYKIADGVPNISSSSLENSLHDKYGFDSSGIHKDTLTQYDERGFDVNGVHKDTETYYNPAGFNRDHQNINTGNEYDFNGFDEEGFDENGYGLKSCKYSFNSGDDHLVQVIKNSTLNRYWWNGDLVAVSDLSPYEINGYIYERSIVKNVGTTSTMYAICGQTVRR